MSGFGQENHRVPQSLSPPPKNQMTSLSALYVKNTVSALSVRLFHISFVLLPRFPSFLVYPTACSPFFTACCRALVTYLLLVIAAKIFSLSCFPDLSLDSPQFQRHENWIPSLRVSCVTKFSFYHFDARQETSRLLYSFSSLK